MRSRGLVVSIVFVAILVLSSLGTLVTGVLKPVLGLDLEGGVSVILAAPPGTSSSVMNQALENIRNRVDAVGVAEPQIFVNGRFIDVELPGLARGTIEERPKHQWCLIGSADQSYGCEETKDAATTLLDGATVQAQVTQVCLTGLPERPPCVATQQAADDAVKAITVVPESQASPAPSATVTPSATASPTPAEGPSVPTGRYCLNGTGLAAAPCYADQDKAQAALDGIDTVATQRWCLNPEGEDAQPLKIDQGQSACADTEDDAQSQLDALKVTELNVQYCVIASSGKNLGCFLNRDLAQAQLQETGQERLIQLIGTTARLEERQVLGTVTAGSANFDATPVTCATQAEQQTKACDFDTLKDQPVTFLSHDGRTKYQLGPVEITGDMIKKATAVFRTATQQSLQTGWEIDFTLTGEGTKTFGDVTTRLVGQQLAIIVDYRVISAPTVQSAITQGSGVITGSFTEARAKDLATQLNAGALPVNLAKQQVLTVSPTLGTESLKQGIVAGIVGLIALMIYLAFYYRLLGVVTWFGMAIWATFALTLVSLLGRTVGYSLTLAGVAGLIVSLGITADSYIVFYERLKDEVRHGKTPRSAIQPAFKRSFRTILTADFVTFLAALILYLVAVSSVRGFALTLGLSTLLDVFVVYFFKRPTVFLIARSPRLQHLRGFGLVGGVAAEPVPVAGGSE